MRLMHHRQTLAFTATVAFTLAACGGGSTSLADEAEERSEQTCGCADFECTTQYIAEFNRITITQEEAIADMSEADQARYKAAESIAADCQNELRE